MQFTTTQICFLVLSNLVCLYPISILFYKLDVRLFLVVGLMLSSMFSHTLENYRYKKNNKLNKIYLFFNSLDILFAVLIFINMTHNIYILLGWRFFLILKFKLLIFVLIFILTSLFRYKKIYYIYIHTLWHMYVFKLLGDILYILYDNYPV